MLYNFQDIHENDEEQLDLEYQAEDKAVSNLTLRGEWAVLVFPQVAGDPIYVLFL